MTIEVKHKRTAVVLGYDTEAIEGKSISVMAANSADDAAELEEKKESDNNGEVTVFYPEGYHGSSTITIRGSKSGEEHGEITV